MRFTTCKKQNVKYDENNSHRMYMEIHLKPYSKILSNVLAVCFEMSFSKRNWFSFMSTKITSF